MLDKVLETLNAIFLRSLSDRRCFKSEWRQLKRRSLFELIMYYKYTLEHALIFFEMDDKWACYHEFSIT